MTRQATALLAANYGSDVGYAWNNIFRLFNVLARSLSHAGLRVCVSFRDPPLTRELFDDDLDIVTVLLDPRRLGGRHFGRTREAIRRHNIRYVYLTDQRPVRFDYALLRMLGVKSIVIHNRVSVPDPDPAPRTGGLNGLVRSGIYRLPLVQADRVYAVSEFVAGRLINGNRLPIARVRKILNGIDVDRCYCPTGKEASEKTIFFAAARATRQKGVMTLIRAAAEVRERHHLLNFVVRHAGDGPDMNLLRQEVDRLDLSSHFVFLGRLDDIRLEQCAADVIVVPSEYGDACPSSVSEALASGRALITTYAGGIPELVGDPRNALLIPPGSAHALAEAMINLAVDPGFRAGLVQNARCRAEHALRDSRYYREVVDAILMDFGISRPDATD